MGQKVRPIGFRVGIFEEWRSRWYAGKKEYADLLIEDDTIRKFIKKRYGNVLLPTAKREERDKYKNAQIPKIEIERTRDEVKVIVHVGRPGMIIGRQGQDIDKLQAELQDLTGRQISIKINEMGRPEIDAQLVAEDIADQLQRRASFRRVMKRAMEGVMENGARGVKLELGGRLGGAEMARREKTMLGSVPLTTLRAKINYGFTEAMTAQGHIGIKVWINQGFYDTGAADAADATPSQVPQKPKRRSKR